MAQQNIQHLVTATITAEDIERQFPSDAFITAPADGGRLVAMGRKSEQKIAQWVREQAKGRGTVQSLSADHASEKQISLIMDLIDQERHLGSWHSGPTTLEGVRKMSKKSASTYISAMLDS